MVFRRVEAREALAADFVGRIAFGALCAGVPVAAVRDLEAVTGKGVFKILGMNLSDATAVRAAVAMLDEPVDHLVMNAGGFGGATPITLTGDGVTELFASNVLGNAVLLEALIDRGLLSRGAVLAGSEAARGVGKMGIKKPALKTSSVEEFVSIADGRYFRQSKTDIMSDYGVVKYVAALWMSHMARVHPDLKLVTMSPGSTPGTAVLNFLPPALRFLPEKVIIPHVLPLFGLAHRLEDGAKRLVDALSDDRFKTGVFNASARKTVTGPVVDQATITPDLNDATIQANANAAICRFLPFDSPSGGAVRQDSLA